MTVACGGSAPSPSKLAQLATPVETQVQISVSPAEVSVPSASSQQFVANIKGGSNQKVTWTAVQGKVTASGFYTAPEVSAQTVDSVSVTSVADPTKYATASITITPPAPDSAGAAPQSVSHGPYSISKQEPVNDVPYPEGLPSKRLPSDIMNHLTSGSANIINTTMTRGTGGSVSASTYGRTYVATPGINDYHPPLYYATAKDPVYKVSSCRYSGHGSQNPVGRSFHMPDGAQFSGFTYGSDVGVIDQYLLVWDQTQDVIFAAYRNGSTSPGLPRCSGHEACDISFTYCEMADRAKDRGYGNGGAWGTNGLSPQAGMIRSQELIQGQINHAIYLDTLCTASDVVFPDTVPADTALTCNKLGLSLSGRVANGSLIFLDYTPSQLAYLKTVLPKWQYPVIAAMSAYGGYIGDTSGSTSGEGIYPGRIESGQAYQAAGIKDPLFSWLASNCHGGCSVRRNSGPPASATVYTLNFFANIPDLTGPGCSSGSKCGVVQHMHVADPCVAKGLAGLSASEGACF